MTVNSGPWERKDEAMAYLFKTCEHLRPIEAALISADVLLHGGRPCPHDPEWGTWFRATRCLIDAEPLMRRLHIEPCVEYMEYEGRFVASDATFYCHECRQAISGPHPRFVDPHATSVR